MHTERAEDLGEVPALFSAGFTAAPEDVIQGCGVKADGDGGRAGNGDGVVLDDAVERAVL